MLSFCGNDDERSDIGAFEKGQSRARCAFYMRLKLHRVAVSLMSWLFGGGATAEPLPIPAADAPLLQRLRFFYALHQLDEPATTAALAASIAEHGGDETDLNGALRNEYGFDLSTVLEASLAAAEDSRRVVSAWSCAVCTFDHDGEHAALLKCAMCGAERTDGGGGGGEALAAQTEDRVPFEDGYKFGDFTRKGLRFFTGKSSGNDASKPNNGTSTAAQAAAPADDTAAPSEERQPFQGGYRVGDITKTIFSSESWSRDGVCTQIVEEVPIAGHIAGLVQHTAGNVSHGKRAYNRATKNTYGAAAGALCVASGPVGVVMGTAAGSIVGSARKVNLESKFDDVDRATVGQEESGKSASEVLGESVLAGATAVLPGVLLRKAGGALPMPSVISRAMNKPTSNFMAAGVVAGMESGAIAGVSHGAASVCSDVGSKIAGGMSAKALAHCMPNQPDGAAASTEPGEEHQANHQGS
jgi:hypothetical protein